MRFNFHVKDHYSGIRFLSPVISQVLSYFAGTNGSS